MDLRLLNVRDERRGGGGGEGTRGEGGGPFLKKKKGEGGSNGRFDWLIHVGEGGGEGQKDGSPSPYDRPSIRARPYLSASLVVRILRAPLVNDSR